MGHPLAGVAQTLPELPRVYLDTTYVAPMGGVIDVGAGGNLQAALNQAQPGDVIQLQAGATFTGNFTLPYKTGSGWIYIQSSVLASLPPPGSRVAPAHASLMPKIVTPNASPALSVAGGAHHYRLVGVEITGTLADTSGIQYNLVAFGSGNDFVVDRCYIHGTPNGNYKRGMELNNARTAVVDSYLSEFHSLEEAQAVLGWNGWGPFKIVNNYVEGAGENLMFGGADPSTPNLVPSDIEIRRNYFFKPLTWKVGHPSYAGVNWVVKNNLELKNARRVLIDGNIFENNWQDDQFGTAILFTVRNQGGAAPWSTVEDVTFTKNIIRHVAGAIGMLGRDNINQSQQSARFLVKNNLLVDINSAYGNLLGRIFDTGNGVVDLMIEHNTGFMDQKIMTAASSPNTLFVYRNNLMPKGVYGFIGDGTGEGLDTLNAYFPNAVFARNVLAGGNPSLYPADNFFPASLDTVGFVDLAGGNYRLAASSPYRNAGTDGKDIGADIDAIEAATAGVGPPVPPPPAPALKVYRTGVPIVLDGTLGEWSGAEAAAFNGLSNTATAALLWDDTNLYVAFAVTDTRLAALATVRDDGNLWRDDSVEIYIDTNNDRASAMQPDDYQFLVNLNNVQADLRGTGSGKDPAWNGSWQSVVLRQGTLNSHGDTDAWYTVEIVIPWAQIGVTPVSGMVLGIELAVNDSDPGSPTPFDQFDWAGIAGTGGSYAQPYLWKQVELVGTLPPFADTTPPTVTITTPTSGSTYTASGSPLTLGGSASDDVGVTQLTWANSRGGSGMAAGTTNWTASGIVLQPGSNVLTVTARDAAGNTGTGTLTVTLNDTTAPAVTITSPTSSSTYTTSSSSLTLGGSASDDVGVTQLTWANSRGGSGTAAGTTSWTASGIVLQLGTNVLTVTARDAAGNTSTDTLTIAFTDTTAPTVAITSPTSSSTYTTSNSPLTLGGSASDDVGVTQLTWANNRGGSGTATGTTSWTASGIVLQLGTNVLTVTARDAVGNTATATVTVTLAATFTFTDDPLTAQGTLLKTAHILEVRAAVDSLRVSRGLATFAWTDLTLAPGSTSVKAVHFSELRTALNQAYQAAGRALPTYTDPTLTPGQTVAKAAHLTELRAATRALQ